MHSAPHHQVLHATSQVVVANDHSSWLNSPWAQSPIFLAFAPCFVVLVLVMIRYRISLHRRGEQLTKRKTTRAEYLVIFALAGGLFYLRDKFSVIALILTWPDRTFPYYHANAFDMWVGFLAGGLAARMISALYAKVFLRGGGGSRSGRSNVGLVTAGQSPFHLLPVPPPNYGWFRWPEGRQRVLISRTSTTEEE